MALHLADFITQLRNDLLDTVTPYLWSDAALGDAVHEGIDEFSFLFPAQTFTPYNVANGDKTFTIYPGGAGAGGAPEDASSTADVIAVLAVELPIGTPIPQDQWTSTNPAPATSSRTANGYRIVGNLLRLRNAASGGEVGTGKLGVLVLQTYHTLDSAGTVAWDGPQHDVSLVILLAKRNAYQLLAEWQAREQGITTPTISTGTDVHIDVNGILASLEVQITRALELRQIRADRVTALSPIFTTVNQAPAS